MSELSVDLPAEEAVDNGTLQRKLMRAKRAAGLLGAVGVRQGTSLLVERIITPDSDHPRTIDVNGLEKPLTLTAAHSDIAMLQEIISRGAYDLPGLDDEIDGRLIIDLGANIGVASALFASRYPNSKVLAVEPHPRNFDYLEQNASCYDGRIIPHKNAIGLVSGVVSLLNPEESVVGRHAVYEFRTGRNGGVTNARVMTPEELTSTAENLSSGERIGLLKINIEGEEKDLLASRRLDPLLRHTNVAIIEAHDRKVGGTSEIVLAAAGRANLRQFDRRDSFYFFRAA